MGKGGPDMIGRAKRRLAVCVLMVAGLLHVSTGNALAVDQVSLAPGFNGSVRAISAPDANGTRYLGGDFTAFDAWDTGSGAVVDSGTGSVDRSFPRVEGSLAIAISDGAGGFFIGGSFSCLGPNISGTCSGANDVQRFNAAHILSDGSVSAWNPDPNDSVVVMALSGGTVFMGGSFTSVGGETRRGVAAVSASGAGAVDQSWNPDLYYEGSPGQLIDLAVADGNVYMCGVFTKVGGASGTTRNYAAAVDATTGNLTGWDPNSNNWTKALEVAGDTVYLGGEFTQMGGESRKYLAAVDAATGSLKTWKADVSGSQVLALDVSGGNLYIGGPFSSIKGVARSNAGAVSTADGAVQSWNPSPNRYVVELEVDGSSVYLGGGFTSVGGSLRNGAAKVGTDGTLSGWDPNPGGDQYASGIYALTVAGGKTYLGGYFKTMGGELRNRLAAVNLQGVLTPWSPATDNLVRTVQLSGSTAYIGGDFTRVAGTDRTGAAAIGTSDASVTAWDPQISFAGNYEGPVYDLEILGDAVFLAGSFDTVAGTSRQYLAKVATSDGALDLTWNPNPDGIVRTVEASGGSLFIGGSFHCVGPNPGGSCLGPDDFKRTGVAKIQSSGAPSSSWNPALLNFGQDGEVYALDVSNGVAYLSGNMNNVNGSPVDYAAGVLASDGSSTGWAPKVRSSANAIETSGSTVFLGGDVYPCGGSSTPSTNCDQPGEFYIRNVAAVGTDGVLNSSWKPNPDLAVYALAVDGSTVYVGGRFTKTETTNRRSTAAVDVSGEVLGQWPSRGNTLSVVKSGSGSGTVISSVAGIDCGVDCSEDYGLIRPVTLTPTPDAGSVFSGWSGACTGTVTCQVTVDQAKSVTATFSPEPAPVLATPGVTGPGSAKRGKSVTYKITVKNTGAASITGLKLSAAGKGVSASKQVGELGAGQTTTVALNLKFSKTGKVVVSFKATSTNAGSKSVSKTVTVKK